MSSWESSWLEATLSQDASGAGETQRLAWARLSACSSCKLTSGLFLRFSDYNDPIQGEQTVSEARATQRPASVGKKQNPMATPAGKVRVGVTE